MPTLKDKVNLLDEAVLTNNAKDVQALFAKYHDNQSDRKIRSAIFHCSRDTADVWFP